MTIVRELADADAEAYVAFRRAALLDSPLAFGASPSDDFVGSAEIVRQELRRSPDWIILGAFEDGLIGAVGLFRNAHRKAAHKVQVWGMYVAPTHRRTGIAARLLQAAIAHARTLPGVSWVKLSVTDAAPEARRLYERMGFEEWGTEPDALRHEGETAVEHHMALRL